MVLVAFNKDYSDHELKRDVKANEAVEMTVKRADELVEVIQAQSDKFPAYKDFNYKRVDLHDDKTEETDEESNADEKVKAKETKNAKDVGDDKKK